MFLFEETKIYKLRIKKNLLKKAALSQKVAAPSNKYQIAGHRQHSFEHLFQLTTRKLGLVKCPLGETTFIPCVCECVDDPS